MDHIMENNAGEVATLRLMDTTTAEGESGLTHSYFRGCDGLVIMVDKRDAESAHDFGDIIKGVHSKLKADWKKIVTYVVANRDAVEDFDDEKITEHEEEFGFELKDYEGDKDSATEVFTDLLNAMNDKLTEKAEGSDEGNSQSESE